MNQYDIGDVVRVQGTFTTSAGAAVDPGTVTFKLKTPYGVATTYIYGTDAAVVKTGTGAYYVDYLTTVQGVHHVRWAGTVANIAAGESSFEVIESQFD